MENGEIISLPTDSPRSGGANIELNENGGESGKLDFQPGEIQSEEDMEIGGISGDDAEEDNQPLRAAENGSKLDELPTLQISFECSETVVVAKKSDSLPPVYADHLCLVKKDEALLSNQHELPRGEREISASSLSGVKRPRLTVDEGEPLVRVSYRSLTRDSKRKLKELLQEWSQWHAQHCSSSSDSGKALESGEDTFFPAIQVGLDKSPALSFWMENERRDYTKKELISVDEKSVPIYDRGFSLALTSNDGSNNLGDTILLEVGEGSRCFNCGSYSHALKECPKPRDNVAVNNARKQHISRRGQNGSSRNPTRYYQDTPGGKFDGLRPGNLDSETRRLLGLGELDPPPWLNRMREIGYPPGYLGVREEDQPSGITIFGEDEIFEDGEEGEILERSFADQGKSMSVKFPGLNAPIPENADERLWDARPSDINSHRDRSSSRYNPTDSRYNQATESRYDPAADYFSRSRFHNHDQRPPRGLEDEPPPPGCDIERSPITSSRRYGDYDPAYYSRGPRDGSSSLGRSLPDRVRRSHDDSSTHYSYRY